MMVNQRLMPCWLLHAIIFLPAISFAFAPISRVSVKQQHKNQPQHCQRYRQLETKSKRNGLATYPLPSSFSGKSARYASAAADVSITAPTQEEAEQYGIREWPQQAKSKGTFTETSKNDQTLTRYILDGKGRVQVDDEVPFTVKTGDLVEVTGEAKLTWEVISDEMIILTPGFEQLGLFAGVAIGFVVLLTVLVATSGN